MENRPFVSVIIPCYQEKDFICKCLDSLLKNDYPKESFEILVVDGGSTDGTREIVEEYRKKNQIVKLKNNPEQFPPFALNAGIRESKGSIIIRCDTHAVYTGDYISRLVEWLQKDSSIGNIGGTIINKSFSETAKGKAISLALNSVFCVGPNRFRTGVTNITSVDTVPFGAWRREIFDEVGFFDEEFLRAQDLELNMRLKKRGYKILIDPAIRSYYYTRESFIKLWKMMYQYGYWKNLVNKKLKMVSSLRQFAPPFLVLYVFLAPLLSVVSLKFLIPLGFYFILIIFYSLLISIRAKEYKIPSFCAFAFIISHFGYGCGYLKGFVDFFLRQGGRDKSKQATFTR